MKSPYTETIRAEIARQGKIGTDPRHVEAYMRLENSTLDGLPYGEFKKEVGVGIACIELSGEKYSEKVALSFGL